MLGTKGDSPFHLPWGKMPLHYVVSEAVRFNLALVCGCLFPFCRYGSKRVGPIPQNSTLIFDVELVNVK